VSDQNTQKSDYVVPARLRRLYDAIDSSLLEFGSLEPRQKAIATLAKELHVDKAQMRELVNHARASHPQINAVARVHKLIENAKASGKKPDLSMFRRLQPAAKSAGKDDMWLGAQLGYIPQFIEEAERQKEKANQKSKVVPIIITTILVLAALGGGVWKITYGDLLAEQKAQIAVDHAAWEEAKELGSSAGYNSYLRNHPGGLHADQAKQELSDLDEKAWQEANLLNTRKAYERYLGEFNNYGDKALELMDQLLPGDNFRDCIGCPEMVAIPAGTFQMGSREGDETELPVHDVSIGKPFAVGIFEVTFAEWDLCAAKGDCDKDIYDSGWGRGNRPAVNVSWDDASAYVQWLSKESGEKYRLLTESEWEYSARSGSRGEYWWGLRFVGERAVCEGCESGIYAESTAEVGKYQGNPFGLIDTAGNVSEWVADCWHSDYSGAPVNGEEWLAESAGDCSQAVVRGGSWLDKPKDLRSSSRDSSPKSSREINIGFRVAREI